MALINTLSLWHIPYILVFATLAKVVAQNLQRRFVEWKKGYGAVTRYSQWDTVMGLDVAYAMTSALKRHTFLPWLQSLHDVSRAKTVSFNFLGTRFVHTIDPENMKALFATPIWRDFGVAPLRHGNNATTPFADKGVGTNDGQEWEFSRQLIKPYFARENWTNTQRLEHHTDNLLDLVPESGETFDMQAMLQRWFLDTSTEFIFGESLESLHQPERAEIAWAMTTVLRGLRFRLMMVRWLWLFRHKAWFDAIAVVHAYVNRHIDKAYADLERIQAVSPEADSKDDGAIKMSINPTASDDERGCDDKTRPMRSDLMFSMVSKLKDDRERLRSEILVLFAPNNDTTSIFISNVFWNLARHPQIYALLREEVLSQSSGEGSLSFERLKSMKYLDAVLNETHRLYPVNVTQTRTCLKDSSLPVGGGADQKLPILLRKGDVVRVNKSGMFRDKDVWGPDADIFRPERFLASDADQSYANGPGLSPTWSFMPFSGGPRRCPAQNQVTTEAMYCVARFVQRFKALENRDDTLAYCPEIRVSPVHQHGVKISVVPA